MTDDAPESTAERTLSDAVHAMRADPRICRRCSGCGQVAHGDDASSWLAWASLPPGSDLAVRLGIVFPVTCPSCAGTGRTP